MKTLMQYIKESSDSEELLEYYRGLPREEQAEQIFNDIISRKIDSVSIVARNGNDWRHLAPTFNFSYSSFSKDNDKRVMIYKYDTWDQTIGHFKRDNFVKFYLEHPYHQIYRVFC